MALTQPIVDNSQLRNDRMNEKKEWQDDGNVEGEKGRAQKTEGSHIPTVRRFDTKCTHNA